LLLAELVLLSGPAQWLVLQQQWHQLAAVAQAASTVSNSLRLPPLLPQQVYLQPALVAKEAQ
jgi:hypothetical protein